ncbi:MAG: GNAT family N-acetyltransferase [Oscillospiraceae bacterium]|nr:GNAT family N-acetyltransferase [Oscillospiraceae bacterium]
MKFETYENTEAFAADTLEILLENEVQNNLPISFIDNKKADKSDWLLGSVKDENGGIALVAACTPPFNIVLYETGNRQNDAAVRLLSDELKSAGFIPPGVTAEQGLAQRFAETFCENRGFHRHMSMNIMHLDAVKKIQKAPGRCRPLREDDLYYTPYWARASGEECRVEVFDIPTYVERQRSIVEANTYYIWEDGRPVSQAAQGRKTQNGVVLAAVYTPPHYRGRGYASSVVAELSQILLERGNKFCCLFADAENPISCGIYRKIGYYDLCVFDEIRFENGWQ